MAMPMTECHVCHRMHTSDQPCPLRIANAYTMQQKALEKLTDADKKWMAEHPDFSVLDTVEDAILESMPQGTHLPIGGSKDK